MAASASTPARRRRGEELQAALLGTAWDELVEIGYARLTMESVAARARTGIAVLYRRWANKEQLVLAAAEHYRNIHPIVVPDTGTLAADLFGLLTAVSEARAIFFAIAAGSAFSGLLADTGLTPAQVRDKVLGHTPLGHADIVYRRAHERGEIDLARLPASVLGMPFDLVRHDLLMDLRPPEPARLHAIVDELFMPLVRTYQPRPAAAARPTGDERRSAGTK